MVQNEKEFIVTEPRALHFGVNLGRNVAEAVNFSTPEFAATFSVPYMRVSDECALKKRRKIKLIILTASELCQ